jgi:hypothetical protein
MDTREAIAPKTGRSFDERFRSAARRVLLRRGVPEREIEAEIARLRSARVDLPVPTAEELDAEAERHHRQR